MNRSSGYQSLNDVGPYERDSIAASSYYSSYPVEKTHGRRLFDGVDEDEEPQWYWRLIALASNWMILGGYLILPSTFSVQPQLRFSRGVLYVIIVALLTGGYSLTLLLWFACPSRSFRRDAVFLPTAGVSAFSFLAILYLVASSAAYSFSFPTYGITISLTAVSAIIYGLLAFSATRRMKQALKNENNSRTMAWNALTGTPSVYSAYSTPPSTYNAGTWMEPGYYQNFIANMHPTAYKAPLASDPSRNSTAGTGFPQMSEEDMVNQQMAMLLRKRDTGPSPDASQNTYRLEWTFDDVDEPSETLAGKGRTRTLTIPTVRLAPPGQASERNRSRSGSGPMSRLGRAMKISGDRGRNDAKSGSEAREKSREERKREIELGTLS